MTQKEKLIIIRHMMQVKKEMNIEISLLEQQAKTERFPVPSPYYHQAKGKFYALQNLILALGLNDVVRILQEDKE